MNTESKSSLVDDSAYNALKEFSLEQEKELTLQLESLQAQYHNLKYDALKLEGERNALVEVIKLLIGGNHE